MARTESKERVEVDFSGFGLSGSSSRREKTFKVKVVNFHSCEGNVVRYTLAVQHGSTTKVVTQKRFTDFTNLDVKLNKVLPWICLPSFPSKFFNTSPEKRMVALNEYLVKLATVLNVPNDTKAWRLARAEFSNFADPSPNFFDPAQLKKTNQICPQLINSTAMQSQIASN